MEEQAEEDIIRLVDEDTDIKRELEESGSNISADSKFFFFFLFFLQIQLKKHDINATIL